jgi:hypothetical protein
LQVSVASYRQIILGIQVVVPSFLIIGNFAHRFAIGFRSFQFDEQSVILFRWVGKENVGDTGFDSFDFEPGGSSTVSGSSIGDGEHHRKLGAFGLILLRPAKQSGLMGMFGPGFGNQFRIHYLFYLLIVSGL